MHKQMDSERFNCTPTSMLGKLPQQGKLHWKVQVATLVHAYRCRSSATGFSPYFLVFGSHPRIALAVAFGVKFADMESVNTEKHGKIKKLS